jgi:hypothetical protein
MNDHSRYEELAALASGGLLSHAERMELSEHTKSCPDCLRTEREFADVVRSGLPLAEGSVRQTIDTLTVRSDKGMRSRFLRRAKAEGMVFSQDVEGTVLPPNRQFGRFILSVAGATAVCVTLLALAAYELHWLPSPREPLQAAQQVVQLKRDNTALAASVSQLNQSLASGQREIESLRQQLGSATAAADKLRQNGELARAEAERSSSQNVRLVEEARNQESLLAEAKDEATRANQLRLNDEASLAKEEARITELSDRLRIASATLDMERQLAAAGKDIRELMASRQLHVIDVHDTDPNGNTTKAFGRVFLTEGKSLTFYAFDLDQERVLNAKHTFQVWAGSEDRKDPSHSLGILTADAKARGRWILKVNDSEALKQIKSVFVTIEPSAGGKQPSGQKLLYAYLGQANHPYAQ